MHACGAPQGQCAALLIHNQLSHVSLPSVNEFSSRLDIFQGLKINLQLQRPRMSIPRKSAIIQQWSFNFRSQPAKEDAQESIIAFPVHEKALPQVRAANLERKVGGNQFQPSQNLCRCKRVISLFSLCVDPATTCLSPHEATPFAGRKLVESSAVSTAGQKSLPPCQEFNICPRNSNNVVDGFLIPPVLLF